MYFLRCLVMTRTSFCLSLVASCSLSKCLGDVLSEIISTHIINLFPSSSDPQHDVFSRDHDSSASHCVEMYLLGTTKRNEMNLLKYSKD